MKWWVRALVTVALTWTGCGGEDPPNYQRIRSELPAETPLMSLSPPQAELLCEEMQTATATNAQAVHDVNCLSQSVTNARTAFLAGVIEDHDDAVSECRANYAACLEETSPARETDFATECEYVLDVCHVTVGELEDCLNKRVEVALELADFVACQRLADAPTQTEYKRMEQLEHKLELACTPVDQGCPETQNCSEGLDAIPQSWICDGEKDCEGGEDEANCLPQ